MEYIRFVSQPAQSPDNYRGDCTRGGHTKTDKKEVLMLMREFGVAGEVCISNLHICRESEGLYSK